MRLLSVLLATLAITNVMAQDSFCVKYAKALFNKTDLTLTGPDEVNLISFVVGRVVVGCDNTPANQFGIPGFDPAVGTSPFRFYGKSACTYPNPASPLATVNGLVADATNAPFFLGTVKDYTSATTNGPLNTAAGISGNPSIRFVNVTGHNVTAFPATTGTNTTQGLIGHLVSFFGRDLGCRYYNNATANGIPVYQGNSNMAAVHQNMNITNAVWSEFIGSFSNTLKSFGVTGDDITNIVSPYVKGFLLGAPNNNQICNQADCDCALVGGVQYTKVNGACVAPGGSGTPTPTVPAGNGTTSPPTKASASTVSMSVVTIFAALLLALL